MHRLKVIVERFSVNRDKLATVQKVQKGNLAERRLCSIHKGFTAKMVSGVEADMLRTEALLKLSEVVAEAGNTEAAENMNALLEEVAKPEPKQAVLQSLWGGIVTAVPTIASMTEIAEKIKGLWS